MRVLKVVVLKDSVQNILKKSFLFPLGLSRALEDVIKPVPLKGTASSVS
jgi:hypothetical protein